MKFGISEIARELDVDRNLVKSWAYHFKDYLSSGANPKKGTPRQFTPQDLRILAYVYFYWEDNPDFECIRIGLNRGEYESEQYDDLITSMTPIFDELTDDLDETWRHVCVVGGMSSGAFDTFTLAESYKLAGDTLVKAALSTAEPHELIYPIIYNYRHAIELYLKALLSTQEKKHDLRSLLEKLRYFLNVEFGATIPTWFEKVIMAFDDFDPDSTAFRYGDNGVFSRRTGEQGEFCINLPHIKQLMDWMASAFHRIRYAEMKAT